MKRYATMIMMSTLAVAAACGFLQATVGAAGLPGDFAAVRAIEIEGDDTADRMPTVGLDPSVFKTTRDGYPDLRIFDDQDQAVPYLLEKAVRTIEERIYQDQPGRIVDAETTDDNRLIVIFERDARSQPIDRLIIKTPLTDYRRAIRVSGSNDGQTWTPLCEPQSIYDLRPVVQFHRDTIDLDPNTFKRLKIEIDELVQQRESGTVIVTDHFLEEGNTRDRTMAVHARPFRLGRLVAQHAARVERRKTMTTESFDIPRSAIEVKIDEDAQTTEVTFETGRRPITELVLETPDRNFTRRVRLYRSPPANYRGPADSWIPVTDSVVSKVSFQEFSEENLRLRFSETRAGRLKLVIENRDNPPLQVTGLRATGPVYQVLFLAEAGRAYRMAYGSSDVPQAHYDTAAITRLRSSGAEPTPARLGELDTSVEPTQPPTESTVRRWLRDRRVVVGIIAIMVTLLAAALYGAAVRARRDEAEKKSDDTTDRE